MLSESVFEDREALSQAIIDSLGPSGARCRTGVVRSVVGRVAYVEIGAGGDQSIHPVPIVASLVNAVPGDTVAVLEQNSQLLGLGRLGYGPAESGPTQIPEVWIGPDAPPEGKGYQIWIDTDDDLLWYFDPLTQTWVQAVAGDEVWIGPDTPLLDSHELWVDTDDTSGGTEEPWLLPARRETSWTTAALADQGTATGTVALAAGWRALVLTTSVAARVRLYADAAARTADAARPVGTDPHGDHGLMLEVLSVAGELVWRLSPTVDGFLTDPAASAVPWSVTNTSGATGPVTVTLSWLQTEGG